MDLVISFDEIADESKKKFLLETLKFLGIGFKTLQKPQTVEEYNHELEKANNEIEEGNYTTMDDLLKEMEQW